jgi:hypothetical protein
MDRIIIKADMVAHDSNLIRLVRWLFPECQIHVVPAKNTPRHKAQNYSSIPTAVMKANLDG